MALTERLYVTAMEDKVKDSDDIALTVYVRSNGDIETGFIDGLRQYCNYYGMNHMNDITMAKWLIAQARAVGGVSIASLL